MVSSSAILEKNAEAVQKFIPAKSLKMYERKYGLYCDLCKKYKIKGSSNEEMILAYVLDLVR